MERVIVNIARSNSSAKSLKTRLHLRGERFNEEWDEIDELNFLPSFHSRHLPQPNKEVGDRLNPLSRFLESRLGQSWDRVYSEIRFASTPKTMRGWHMIHGHLFTHMMEQQVSLCGQTPVGRKGSLFSENVYVDPDNRLLTQTKRTYPTARETFLQNSAHPVVSICIQETLVLKKFADTWDEVRYIKHAPSGIKTKTYDQNGQRLIIRWGDADSLLEEVSRRQLAASELRKVKELLKAPRLPYHKRRMGNTYIICETEYSFTGKPGGVKYFVHHKFAIEPKFRKIWEGNRRQERAVHIKRASYKRML